MIGFAPARRVPSASSVVLGLSLLMVVPATPAMAQDNASTIKWWHGAIAVGGVSALMLLDRSVRDVSQDLRGTTGNEVASTIRHFAQPEVYGTITAGLLTAGLISGDSRIIRAGGRLAATMALTAGLTAAGKYIAGRPRPDAASNGIDGDDFLPFSGQEAMPSGHTAMAFALATSLADDIHRPWATVGLYSAAGAVAWSRLNDNRHWFSDVAAGALIGITSAKFAAGRWKIFGVSAPSVLAAPHGLGLGWQAQF